MQMSLGSEGGARAMIASEGEERRWWESVWCEAEQRQDMADPPPAAPQARGEGALSPLSGSYLLIVVAEPKTAQHKDVILNRISKGKSRKHRKICDGETT